jgi:hypothetical protein
MSRESSADGWVEQVHLGAHQQWSVTRRAPNSPAEAEDIAELIAAHSWDPDTIYAELGVDGQFRGLRLDHFLSLHGEAFDRLDRANRISWLALHMEVDLSQERRGA